MEFVGNQINMKNVLATLTVAFFVGRINLFDGTFPAAIALITVMVAVSTVYIYLVPVIWLGMLTFSGQGLDFYGDMAAVGLCGLVFLFFHRHRFTINQRTALAAAALLICNSGYYAMENMLYMLSLTTLLKEILATAVYIRAFNTMARILFVGKSPTQITEEKAGLAAGILGVSLVGAFYLGQVVFPLWIFFAAAAACCLGIQAAMTFLALAAVFWQCQGETHPEIFVSVFAAFLAGWYLAAFVEVRYRKTVLGLVIFAMVAGAAGDQVYGIAGAMALFIAVPADILREVGNRLYGKLIPRKTTEGELHLAAIKNDLLRKQQVFRSLAKLYGNGMDSRQIISYQFAGMARTVEGILEDLAGRGNLARGKGAPPVAVGEASYAFEAVSGDSCLTFSYGRNHQAMIISDGMGKGSKAQSESRLVVTTLARLMEAGFDVDVAVKTVNGVLMAGKNREMFATVDLAIINRETGRTQIFKMGAASTFVRHGNRVDMLKRPAPPVGIVDGVKLEYIDVRLKKGDLLIMVSDGVTDCDRSDPSCAWLRSRLLEIGSRDPATVAELIVNKAAEKYGVRERDDLTVMVAAI